MSHLDYDPLYINGFYDGGSYLQAVQHLQNELAMEGCCISKPSHVNYTANSIRYLSDIIKLYGDAGIRSLTVDQEYDCVPIMTIEAAIDVIKRPENTVADVIENMTDNQRNTLNYLLAEAIKEKENNKMMMNNNMSNNSMFDAFKGMFGKVDNGMCRLSMNGNIAVKTSNGYKSYNMKEGRLVNCANFVFPMGDEMFFIIPTNKVEQGDIIIVAGLPKCVLKKDSGTITVINYEDSTVETILPERHIFMGETYFYGKVVSMFGEDIIGGGKKSMNKIMKFMVMSEMMKGFGSNSSNSVMSNMMPLMMMSGGNMGDLFSGIFDFGDKEETEHADGETDEYDNLTASLRNGKITGEEFIKKVEKLAHDETDKRTESKD